MRPLVEAARGLLRGGPVKRERERECQVCDRDALYLATYPAVTLAANPPLPSIELGPMSLEVCLQHAQTAQYVGRAKLKVLL